MLGSSILSSPVTVSRACLKVQSDGEQNFKLSPPVIHTNFKMTALFVFIHPKKQPVQWLCRHTLSLATTTRSVFFVVSPCCAWVTAQPPTDLQTYQVLQFFLLFYFFFSFGSLHWSSETAGLSILDGVSHLSSHLPGAICIHLWSSTLYVPPLELASLNCCRTKLQIAHTSEDMFGSLVRCSSLTFFFFFLYFFFLLFFLSPPLCNPSLPLLCWKPLQKYNF